MDASIRKATPDDRDALLEVWLRSVRATHSFLTEADIQSMLPEVRDIALVQLEMWVLCDGGGQPVGFIGLTGTHLDALFLAPEVRRRGWGRQLLEHARRLKGPLTVDVNEQNPEAVAFYLACGFRVVGRSEVDGTGRPFPLLHLSESAAATTVGDLAIKNPQKDFGPIAEDYAFFERHATEAAQDAQAYLERTKHALPVEGPLRMLDFGCGSGTFTARFLTAAGWPPERLRLTLVEPVEAARREAVARLAKFTTKPIAESTTLPANLAASFDVVLANHVFYYVPDLPGHLARLIGALSASGVFVTAIAARTNALIEFWITGFGLLGREVPYHTAEDVEAALQGLGVSYEKQRVPYELSFPDSEQNRLRIIRFLLADYLAQMPLRPLLDLFDPYTHAGQIHIRTASDHFTIRKIG